MVVGDVIYVVYARLPLLFSRRAIEEQERRDRELAVRLAQDNQAELVEDLPVSQAVLQQQQRYFSNLIIGNC